MYSNHVELIKWCQDEAPSKHGGVVAAPCTPRLYDPAAPADETASADCVWHASAFASIAMSSSKSMRSTFTSRRSSGSDLGFSRPATAGTGGHANSRRSDHLSTAELAAAANALETHELRAKLALALELLGEREEAMDELRAELAELRAIYRADVETLSSKVAALAAGAAAAPACLPPKHQQ